MNESFITELYYIKNERIKNSANELINLLPDYFFHIPASSTGKYHPRYALGDGGLLRHTKAVVRIGYELLNNETFGQTFTADEKDLLIVAMLLHDGLKMGLVKDKYVTADHPLLAAQFVIDHPTNLTNEEVAFISRVIKSHMGPFNKDYNGNEILPKPSDDAEKFVHLCDYLASKKLLKIEFDKLNNIVE